jgi:hypothetical protein
MPTIRWRTLPRRVQEHLTDRARVRGITARELRALVAWIDSNPDVPAGAWCKDFGSFKLVGEGSLPKTFLTADQPCYGERI